MDEDLCIKPPRKEHTASSADHAALRLNTEKYRANDNPNPNSGLEVLNDPHHLRADLNMIERAVRLGWPITEEKRQRIVDVAYDIANGDKYEPKIRVMAIKALAALDGLNARREATIAAAQNPRNPITVNVGVQVKSALQEEDYLAYLREKALRMDNERLEGLADAGPVCQIGEQGKVEDGPSPGGD